MKTPPNPSAFPSPIAYDAGGGVYEPTIVRADMLGDAGGMTLRDYFAAAALTGMLANAKTPETWEPPEHREQAAFTAYGFADAMLAEKAKS